MDAWTVAIIAFASMVICGMATLLGARYLPPKYISEPSRESVKPIVRMIATVTALILGLMVSSIRANYGEAGDDVQKYGVAILAADLELRHFGEQACDARALLQKYARGVVRDTWGGGPELAGERVEGETAALLFKLDDVVRGLDSTDPKQVRNQNSVIASIHQLIEHRWKVSGDANSRIPSLFLTIVICCLALIFGFFGLFAPLNPVTVAAMVLAPLCIAATLFLGVELGEPFAGRMQISPEPILDVLRYMEHDPCRT